MEIQRTLRKPGKRAGIFPSKECRPPTSLVSYMRLSVSVFCDVIFFCRRMLNSERLSVGGLGSSVFLGSLSPGRLVVCSYALHAARLTSAEAGRRSFFTVYEWKLISLPLKLWRKSQVLPNQSSRILMEIGFRHVEMYISACTDIYRFFRKCTNVDGPAVRWVG